MEDGLATRLINTLTIQRDMALGIIEKLFTAAESGTVTREQIIKYISGVLSIEQKEIEIICEMARALNLGELSNRVKNRTQPGEHDAHNPVGPD